MTTDAIAPHGGKLIDRVLAGDALAAARERAKSAKTVVIDDRVRSDLEAQTEAYYRSLSPAEQEEDKEWSTIAAEGASRIWDE